MITQRLTGAFAMPEHIALSSDGPTFAFSDVHGVRPALDCALVKTGLTTPMGEWIAEDGTQLVGLGDYIGCDGAAVLPFLWELQAQAAKANGRVVLLRGDQEELLLAAMNGDAAAWHIWFSDYGCGAAILGSLGLDPLVVRAGGASRLRLALDTVLPGLRQRLQAMPEWAFWRRTFLSHAGLPPYRDLDDLRPGGEHLWQEARYERGHDPVWNLGGPAFAAAREQGVERIVYGHLPQPGQVKIDQAGRTLCIDTNAAGWPRDDGMADGRALTLVQLAPTGSLAASDITQVTARDATYLC